ncbi:response regulator [Pontibacter qinzhouensis]|uniref:Response regulator n=1 Tax=Pontibacter qinzhouensis TaxID=2603253 RepID=A0A5C8J3K6_9BACT|nr:response regulator [Pontibacter qinzhouensis]TXK29865.1 response regulator [Pontibacter qinzhouensis]
MVKLKVQRVLLVDDDDATVYITGRLLKQSGLEVDLLVARNGEEALAIVRELCKEEHCPELILLDINMPVMDGFEFLEALQQSADLSATAIRIVVLSSSTHYLDRIRAKSYPVVDYVEKPLTIEKLSRFL